jgi:hypothetical protein
VWREALLDNANEDRDEDEVVWLRGDNNSKTGVCEQVEQVLIVHCSANAPGVTLANIVVSVTIITIAT